MYKVLDLFAGAGGLSLGFEQTGKFKVVAAIEKDPAAQLTYKYNHPNVSILEDILEVSDYEDYKHIDVIIGGPPCQGFSNANRQKFNLINHNNSLVKKYIEFIEKIKPMAFVMENVAMFKSEKHRYFLTSEEELLLFKDYVINEEINLLPPKKGVDLSLLIDVGKNISPKYFLINERLLKDFILLQKNFANKDKLDKLMKSKKYAEQIEENIFRFKARIDNPFENYGLQTKLVLLNLINELEEIKCQIEVNSTINLDTFIDIQRYFYTLLEFESNNISRDNLQYDEVKGLFLILKSITVNDYLRVKLDEEYEIVEGVVNAASFGAAQLRKRFIAMGIRKDLVRLGMKVELPEPVYDESNFNTVYDAIADLENVTTSYEVDSKELFIPSQILNDSLMNSLRDSELIFNHLITKTNDHILERFKQLKQGQNFHDLDKELISNYSDPSRTQNSIYKRLDYSMPAPTVTNVRKAMWIHPNIDRAISVREAARIQGFPDSFVFQGNKDKQYQQVGNAVPPILSNAIAEKLYCLITEPK